MNGTLQHPLFGKNMCIIVIQVSRVIVVSGTKVQWKSGFHMIKFFYFLMLFYAVFGYWSAARGTVHI